MKTFIFAALLATVPTASQAAVTITFSGTTFAPTNDPAGGSYIRDHVPGRADILTADQTAQQVSGTIVIDSVAAGANQVAAPDAYYDNLATGASFMTVNFMSQGVTPLQLAGTLTTQAINSDAGLEFDLFSADGTYSYVFTLVSYDAIPTVSYGGFLLPDFTAATNLFFGVMGTVGNPAGSYIETNSLGVVTAISQAVTPVPEPATWMMMIGGFGLVGAAVRRSRRPALQIA